MPHNISLPTHRYVWVVPSFVLRSLDFGPLIPAVWFGVSVTAGRSIGCHVLLENGAMVVDLPLHALRHDPDGPATVALSEVVAWDCYGTDAECWQPSVMSGLSCGILSEDHKTVVGKGSLWFVVDHVRDGYSLHPAQHKHLWVVAREDGALMLLPQDRVLVEEQSFTDVKGIPPIKRQDQIWSAE